MAYAPVTHQVPARLPLTANEPRHRRARRRLWVRWSRPASPAAVERAAWLLLIAGVAALAFALGVAWALVHHDHVVVLQAAVAL